MRRPILFLTLLAVIAMGLAAPASARPDARPFKGSVTGEVTFPFVGGQCPADNPLFFGGVLTVTNATGTASHLGRTIATGEHCSPATEVITGGQATFAAANGDEVYLEYAGTVDPVVSFEDQPEIDTPVVADVAYEIVGGTGRFERATGEGDMTVTVLFKGFGPTPWPATWTWSGTIGY